jgi:hypothetical protein
VQLPAPMPPTLAPNRLEPPPMAARSPDDPGAAQRNAARASTQPPMRLHRRVLGASIGIAFAGVVVAVSAIWWAMGVPRGHAEQPALAPVCTPLTAEIPLATSPVASAMPLATPSMPSTPSGAANAVPSSVAATSTGCQLRISANAKPASLWIDGVLRGASPSIIDVPCRRVSIELRHPRYATVTRRVTPSEGVTDLDVRLTRPMVTVKILSQPAGATVRVNGTAVGRTPLDVSVPAFERGTIVWSHTGGATKTLQIYPQRAGTVFSATLPLVRKKR